MMRFGKLMSQAATAALLAATLAGCATSDTTIRVSSGVTTTVQARLR